MHTFLMPTLGADMEAGTLVAWHKRPGDAVRRGETIAEVDTEKGVIDVEVFVEGILDEVLVPPGRRVPVGTPLATIREAPETGEERPGPVVEAKPEGVHGGRDGRPTEVERLRMSPAARRRARELAVDPRSITATGPRGAITIADVERAAAEKGPAPAVAPVPSVPPKSVAPAPAPPPVADRMERMRRTIAAAMSHSKREIPHYYLTTTIDMQRATAWLAVENARRPVEQRLLPGVLLLKAAAKALRTVPELNAVWEQGRVVLKEQVHVGVAISLRQGGLVILALHDTATRPLDELMDALRDLTSRARSGRIRSSELSDSTITVTSLGDRGVESVHGVIYPPQVAIVGFGRIADRPWAVGGGLFVRPIVTATLAADHRVSDGHRGGLFLDAVDRLLQEPEAL